MTHELPYLRVIAHHYHTHTVWNNMAHVGRLVQITIGHKGQNESFGIPGVAGEFLLNLADVKKSHTTPCSPSTSTAPRSTFCSQEAEPMEMQKVLQRAAASQSEVAAADTG